MVTAHELAEAVTDPNIGDPFRSNAWYDSAYPDGEGEVGDLANGQTVYLNGYAVQRIADQKDQAMTPAGATAIRPVSFILKANGDLWEYSASGATLLVSGIASISDQGIDNWGYAFVDAVTTSGLAKEYHDTAGAQLGLGTVQDLTLPGVTVKDAKADQGVSYLLLSNGVVAEYHDATPMGGSSWSSPATSHAVASIDAGTDKEGVNAVDVIYAPYKAVQRLGIHIGTEVIEGAS